MQNKNLVKRLQQSGIPSDWKLCAVRQNKIPYHPDQKFLENGKPDPNTPDWKTPIEIDRLIDEINRGKCRAIGLLTGEISEGLVALDHDGLSCDPLIEKRMGLPVKKALPITVKFTSHREGRYQALYQISEIFWPFIQSIKWMTGTGDEQLDFRWDGRQSVFMGEHPETIGYDWVPDCSPNDVAVAAAPRWVIRQMLTFRICLPQNKREWKDRDWALEYLSYIPNDDLDWEAWRNVLFALHYAEVEEEIALVWSMTSDKYSDNGFYDVWNHIKDNCPDPITVATLAEIAKANGWKGKPEKFHSPINQEDVEDIEEEVQTLFSLGKIQTPQLFIERIHRPVLDLAERMNLPVEIYICALLPILASLIHSKTRLVINPSTDHKAPAILWFGLVGESGTKKSPVLKALTFPLNLMQEVVEEDYQKKGEIFKQELAEWERLDKKERGEKPEVPAPPREYYLSDFTLEALADVIKHHPESGILFWAEGLRYYFDTMDMYRSGKGGDRTKWLSFYDGGAFKVNRKTTGRVSVSQSSISVLGGVQPSVLRTIFEKDDYSQDGLWPRFAWVQIPLSVMPFHNGGDYVLTDVLREVYENLKGLQAQEYCFSPEAKNLWIQWHNEIEQLIINEPCPALRTLYPKAKERAARIALVVHLTHSASRGELPPLEVSAHIIEQSIAFTKWLLAQAKVLYAHIGVTGNAESSRIHKFVERFRGLGWVTGKQVRNWWSAKEKPKMSECRKFMAEVVSLKLAESNGKQVNSSEYQIRVLDGSQVVTEMPQNPVMQSIEPLTNPSQNVVIDSHPKDNLRDITAEPIPDRRPLEMTMATKDDDGLVTPETFASQEMQKLVTTVTTIPEDKYNPRHALTVKNNHIQVDLERLSLDYKPEIEPPKWKPTTDLDPYESLTKLYLDIETTGLDPQKDRVTMAGLMNDQGEQQIFVDGDEAKLLGDLWNYLKVNQPEFLITHNGFEFDLPFLVSRWKNHGITHYFRQGQKSKKITASSFHGKPIEFTPIYWQGTEILDTFQQVCIWDKQAAKLEGYGLKKAVLALGLRSEKRLELSHAEIQDCWQTQNYERLTEYLVFDLEDTKLLADFLLPVVYYQMAYVPDLSFQQLAIASPALKAQKIHEQLYRGEDLMIEADQKLSYEGGGVACLCPGLNSQVAKIDVASLYPSIMLRYGICSRKDNGQRFLGVLAFMTQERLKLKQQAKNGDRQADYQQKALKVLINGSYGFLGTGFYSFNDYQAAALVTAYGRKILSVMTQRVEQLGGTLIEIDTDGIIFSHPDPQTVWEQVQQALPTGINVELELQNAGIYLPKAKNYVLVLPDGKTEIKGLYRKRDRYPLEKEFPIELVKRYFLESPEAARNYYHQIRNSLTNRTVEVKQLMVTRKIAVNEKKLVDIGIGQLGDVVSFYYREDHSSGKTRYLPTVLGDYAIAYYREKLDRQCQEILGELPLSQNIAGEQLSLFRSS